MSKTAAEIDAELVLYNCCFADKAIQYIQKEVYGFQDTQCKLDKLTHIQLLLKYLACHETIIELETLTQIELEELLEQLNDLCGCATCQDSSTITDDTLPTGLDIAFNLD